MLRLVPTVPWRRPDQIIQGRQTAAGHHGHAADEKENAHVDQRRVAQRRSGGNATNCGAVCRRIVALSRPRAPGNQVRLCARIWFYSFLELRDRLRERLGKRHLLCVIVVRTQPLAESLANAAVRGTVEQWRIIRCHDMLLRKTDAPAACIGGTMRADRFRPKRP